MRVVMVILEYHPITGGAQQQLAAVAPLLREAGVDIHVLTRRVRGLPASDVIDGIPVYRLPAPGPRASASLAFTAAALARLRTLRPDVVHAYSLFSPATIAVLAKRCLGVATVVKVLRGGRAGDAERLGRKPLAGVRIASLRAGIDRFLAISREIDADLDGLGIAAAQRVAVPNGVDVERFQPVGPSERPLLRSRLGLPEGPLAVFCGRLVEEKRIDRLLEAWPGVRAVASGAQLAIVGGGPCEGALRRAAGEGICFPGEVTDVAPYLEAADLFVLPSATEGLSNALLEAMAAGLPVIATRVGGAPDLVTPGENGWLVDPDDVSGLADAVGRALAGPHRARVGACARKTVVDGYSLRAVADRLCGIYAELAPTPRDARPAGTAGRGVAA